MLSTFAISSQLSDPSRAFIGTFSKFLCTNVITYIFMRRYKYFYIDVHIAVSICSRISYSTFTSGSVPINTFFNGSIFETRFLEAPFSNVSVFHRIIVDGRLKRI